MDFLKKALAYIVARAVEPSTWAAIAAAATAISVALHSGTGLGAALVAGAAAAALPEKK